MRLKSEIWVKAYLRRTAGAGAPGVVVHRGDEDAGQILVKVARLDGTADLYAPAPAGLVRDDGDRLWTLIKGPSAAEADVDEAIRRERRLDPDCWVVEIEERNGRSHLDGWLHGG